MPGQVHQHYLVSSRATMIPATMIGQQQPDAALAAVAHGIILADAPPPGGSARGAGQVVAWMAGYGIRAKRKGEGEGEAAAASAAARAQAG